MTDNKNDTKLTDLLKKVVSTGVSAAFVTEDTIKQLVNELPLPKEFLNGLLENAKNTRNDFIGGIKAELKDYLNKINISNEIDRVLENYDFEINATIKAKKKGGTKKSKSAKASTAAK